MRYLIKESQLDDLRNKLRDIKSDANDLGLKSNDYEDLLDLQCSIQDALEEITGTLFTIEAFQELMNTEVVKSARNFKESKNG